MAGFSRADMENIFRCGVLLGLCTAPDNDDSTLAAQQIADESFDRILHVIKNQKAQAKAADNPNLAVIEEWIKAGKPKGGPRGAMFPEMFK